MSEAKILQLIITRNIFNPHPNIQVPKLFGKESNSTHFGITIGNRRYTWEEKLADRGNSQRGGKQSRVFG